MKRFSTFLLMLVCLMTGAVYWVDVSKNIDLETGFVTYGSYWYRYAVLGVVLVLLLAAAFMAPRNPAAFVKKSRVQGLSSIVCGLSFAVSSGFYFVKFESLTVLEKMCAVLYIITAVWLITLGGSRFSKRLEAPTYSSFLGIVGTLGFYLLCVQRFCVAPSGIVRIGITVRALACLAALLFCTAQLKVAYIPGGKSGGWLFFTGMTAFLLCTCISLPDMVYYYFVGKTTIVDLMCEICLGFTGLSGLVWAFGAVGKPVVPPKKKKKIELKSEFSAE